MTGVQTCALPISALTPREPPLGRGHLRRGRDPEGHAAPGGAGPAGGGVVVVRTVVLLVGEAATVRRRVDDEVAIRHAPRRERANDLGAEPHLVRGRVVVRRVERKPTDKADARRWSIAAS